MQGLCGGPWKRGRATFFWGGGGAAAPEHGGKPCNSNRGPHPYLGGAALPACRICPFKHCRGGHWGCIHAFYTPEGDTWLSLLGTEGAPGASLTWFTTSKYNASVVVGLSPQIFHWQVPPVPISWEEMASVAFRKGDTLG